MFVPLLILPPPSPSFVLRGNSPLIIRLLFVVKDLGFIYPPFICKKRPKILRPVTQFVETLKKKTNKKCSLIIKVKCLEFSCPQNEFKGVGQTCLTLSLIRNQTSEVSRYEKRDIQIISMSGIKFPLKGKSGNFTVKGDIGY